MLPEPAHPSSRPGVPRVAILVDRPDFSAPIDTLAVGRIWDAADVRAYAKLRGQRLADSEGD